ncbi:YhdX family protein [Metabacillus idriensis]|nr:MULTISPECIES: YhdX family protein [Bacillaceae]MCM3595440.1 YhdX family protein [Metabacillus idriensis]
MGKGRIRVEESIKVQTDEEMYEATLIEKTEEEEVK